MLVSLTVHPQELWLAEDELKGADEDQIAAWLERLELAVTASRFTIDELDMDCSVYPGEYDGQNPTVGDIVSYVLDHLLLYSTDPGRASAYGKIEPLLTLVGELEPLEFIAVLTIYADRNGDGDGVVHGAEILRKSGYPYLEHLRAVRRRALAGHLSGRQRREDKADRDQAIISAREQLRGDGVPEREIAGRLARRSWDGKNLSAHQIRRILK